MSAVEISSIRKSYGGVVALSDINITIPSGSFFTLLGPSGCGKTTLLRTIAGFHQQDSGSIAIAGQKIEHVPAHKRDVGMVFQDYAVFPHISVADNIAFGLKQRKVSKSEIRSRVDAILDVVQLKPYASRMPHELSGGQQQRVGLARALVINPKVLLMDEPLSNLDAKLRVQMRVEIRRLQRSLATTSIYVTHDQMEAMTLADRLVVLNGGRIEQVGTPIELYERPATTFVATFIGSPSMNLIERGNLGPAGAPRAGIAGDVRTIGIRPEDLVLGEDPSRTFAMSVTVAAVELVGAESYVHATTVTGHPVVFRVPGRSQIAIGNVVSVSADDRNLHFFDEKGQKVGP